MKKKYYSTAKKSPDVDLREAVIKSLPSDYGLYFPKKWPCLEESFFKDLPGMSISEIALYLCEALIGEDISQNDLKKIVSESITFEAPLKNIDEHTAVLELFHGPTLAFKDFGARFMARLMSHFWRDENQDLVVLAATSGDTGSAVAHGFYQVEGVHVVILYPKGKVSDLQERQLTTFQGNITAIEIQGTFDDCQHLVKQAFLDHDLQRQIALTSANSINIARLYPQTIYYFNTVAQLLKSNQEITFCVPSGNFGNLTAGLIAKKMGLNANFIAATNANDIVDRYLKSGLYEPKPSIKTLSNAMDVGNPSNFPRILELFSGDEELLKKTLKSSSCSDQKTIETIKDCYFNNNYLLDPHGAVGMHVWKKHCQQYENPGLGVILGTAHPAKFLEVVEQAIGKTIDLPKELSCLVNKEKHKYPLDREFKNFKSFLMDLFAKQKV
jgi:threonine synthase